MSAEKREKEREINRISHEDRRYDEAFKEHNEYVKIIDKHRKRKDIQKRDDKKRLEVNQKAKEGMVRLRKNMPDKYFPRGSKNIAEDNDWRSFYEKHKEWLKVSKPDLYEKMKEDINREQKEKEESSSEYRKNVHSTDEFVIPNNDHEDSYEEDEDESDTEGYYTLNEPVNTSEELRAEAELMKKYYENEKKKKLKAPPPPIPQSDPCQYEIIRDNIVKERMQEIAKSGLWTEDELKKMPGYKYISHP